MSKFIAMVLVLASVGFANAQEATPATTAPAWNDVLRTCSEEYKARTDKTKGSEVWQAFLAECKSRKGFVAKKDQNKREFVRVPDKG